MKFKKQVSLIALGAALTSGSAFAQQSLPTIEIGATPLRSSSRSAARPSPAPVQAAPGPAARSAPSAARVAQPAPITAPAPYVSPLVTYQVPASVHVVSDREIANSRKFNVADALVRAAPGVTVNDVGGNPSFPEVDYRGFVASPYAGVPQGLAVFQNGVRINEMWGDTVNWDLIPSVAIDNVAIETGNPLYGLNAIGGAIVLDMKNGFTWQGAELDLRGGSFNRRQGAFQYGRRIGDFAMYAAGEAAGDSGYRYFSGSQIKRFYGDLGWRGENAEVHANVTLGSNRFGASGPAPVDMVAANKASTYTTPQTYKNQVMMFDLNGQVQVNPTTKLLGDIHYRGYNQARVDGNTTEFECEDGEAFCETGDGAATGVPNFFNAAPGGPALGAIDRTWTRINTLGFTGQINNTDKIFGFPNKFTAGVNLEHGFTNFAANEELGIINSDYTVTGFNFFPHEPAAGISPVKLSVSNYYLGAYALDSLDLTDRLTATGGLRYNRASVQMYDQAGIALNSTNVFDHINPMGGLTYKLTPQIAAYGSYSVANRAPTPLELGCSDPNRPCLIDSFLVSDPPLKQVTSNTIDLGLRGGFRPADIHPSFGMLPGTVQWSAGIFRTNAFNDILSIPSSINGRGYFTNAGNTVRQGVELSMRYAGERLSAYVNYTLTDAYFNSQNWLGAPANPAALVVGSPSILVNPGATLPGIAPHRFKAGADYAVTPRWKVGGDLVYAAGSYLVGDWANQFGTLSPYAILNLRTSYDVTKALQLYALVENATNTRARSFGTFFETDSINFANFSNPKMVSVGPPTAFYAGMKWNFGAEPSGWMASARDQLARERGEDAPTPRKWAGLYAGLNAGYGWGATTDVNVYPNGFGDRFAQLWNEKILAEEPEDDGAAWWGLFQPTAPAFANSGIANVSRSGFVGGGQIGWNYQDESSVVLGAEADFQGTIFRGKGAYNGSLYERAGYIDKPEGGGLESLVITRQAVGGGSVSAGMDWLGTFRGKVGYAVTDTLLAYGTGGLAYGEVHASAAHFNASSIQRENDVGVLAWNYANPAALGGSSYSGVRAGWSAGGGVEWMFADNWSAKAEGLYYNLGAVDLVSLPLATVCSSQATNTSGGACARGQASADRIAPGGLLWANSPVSKVQFDGVILRAGVNYHFNWGSNLF
ncbi:TonB-dependent receptor domain-containing protein [Methylocystis parvus]|uniref:TonB-dependent receptor plug domain-containing protein n=1 Tax=Methylocystis parvus TaxID=134 RepID=A0A6B8MA71_9HYPH|nr:TonB-dependent receptor [Methylocystis parvus]QGM99325.1 TonB-dependent receptor plug domain-containing protein [Methylocystis parvus]WBK00286.1 TonB-dependent receptor [Methylocystis parvus OBBP]